ncbi:hypothetical protein MUY27_20150 [Mucilaginibacter sp. RS28]|uniref:BZIP transcription factor n=1 Tax=Mucilaginibacter straminoryzae TaxID=2932774 RepID=A0A9X2BBT2_9SPHI|nr:hypothetical protein [Mucilaginibacter straminoryzae]MCJ8212040.1 hypothetical protein [Mucilaginibacter straminoryzae]
MKKYILIAIFAFLLQASYAQNTYPWPQTGNVGIGTTNPNNKVDVNGGITTRDVSYINGVKFNTVNTYYRQVQAEGYNLNIKSGDGSSALVLPYTNTDYAHFQNYGLVVDGNVGIGTTTPDAKLSVKGAIHTQEVKVDMNNWGDYVFKPDYHLTSLSAVKNYVDQHHHLPEIPSAQEIEKNGANLGELVKLQMKKIEELTLYLIEKDKKQKQLEARLAKLEKLSAKGRK